MKEPLPPRSGQQRVQVRTENEIRLEDLGLDAPDKLYDLCLASADDKPFQITWYETHENEKFYNVNGNPFHMVVEELVIEPISDELDGEPKAIGAVPICCDGDALCPTCHEAEQKRQAEKAQKAAAREARRERREAARFNAFFAEAKIAEAQELEMLLEPELESILWASRLPH